MAAVAVLELWTSHLAAAKEQWVQHTHEVIEALADVNIAVTDIEGAHRRFALTGRQDYALTALAALKLLDDDLSRLETLIQDNPRQRDNVDRLSAQLAPRMRLLRTKLTQPPATADSTQLEAQVNASLDAVNAVRKTISSMVSEERGLLVERSEQTATTLQTSRTVALAGSSLSVFFLVVAFWQLRQEIVRRTAAERAALDREEHYSTTLRSIGDGVVTTDPQGRVVRLNPVAEALTGWTTGEAAGQPFEVVFRIIHEETRTPAVNPIERVLREGITVGLANHTLLIAKDGTERPIADSAAPIRDDSGQLTGVVLVFRDTTEERAAEKQLQEANRFLDSVIENMPAMVFLKEAKELRYVRLNRAGEQLLGLTRDQVQGKNDFDLFPPEQARTFQNKNRELLEGGGPVEIREEPVDTPQGRRWVYKRKILLTDQAGRPQYLLGIGADITERRALNEQLKQAQELLKQRFAAQSAELATRSAELKRSEEQLRQAQKMEAVGQLAGGIAHDFNNMLSIILSYSALAGSQLQLGDQLREDLDEINKAAQRAADLTRQLLAFSRRQVLTPRIVDLSELVQGMDKMLQRVLGEHIELRVLPGRNVGKVRVDPGQIEQVLLNLVVNARDAMPTGGTLTIEVVNVDLDEAYASAHVGVTAGPHVMVAVSDTGTGMDAATQARIFEPFFTTKEQGKGTGLGLSTALGIVQQSAGSIWVYSELGHGTTFKVYLPRVHEGSDAVQRSALPAPSPKLGSETILLVEDEESVRKVARTILTHSGYQILEAQSAEEALLLCRRFSGPIHLLLTDVVMPRMSGRELADQLSPLRPEMQVLYMSGYTDDAILRQGIRDVELSFLQKPLTPDALSRKVREVLDASSRTQA